MNFDGFGMFAVQGLSSIAQNVGQYQIAKAKAASDKRWQEFNNKMVKLQNAFNQNSLTTNENMMRDRVKQQIYQTQISEMETSASAEVAAAATGTIGRSADMVLLDIGRNAARKRGSVVRDQEMQEVVIDNQRAQGDMQTQMQMDIRTIPTPSAGSMLFGIAGDLLKTDFAKSAINSIGSNLKL